MTQREKAKEELAALFYKPRYARVGVSKAFLTELAAKRWVGENEPLSADALIAEAEEQAAKGTIRKFTRGLHKTVFYKLP